MSNLLMYEWPDKRIEKRRTVVTTWRCQVCRTDFRNPRSAEKCAAMPIEPRLFKRGMRVVWTEDAVCPHVGGRRRRFRMKGKIVGISAPHPPDRHYIHSHLSGIRRSHWSHILTYTVRFTCRCGEPRTEYLYAPEMEKLP